MDPLNLDKPTQTVANQIITLANVMYQKRLRIRNWISAGIQASLGLFILAYALFFEKDYPFELNIGRYDAVGNAGVRHGTLNLNAILYLLATFCFVTFGFHVVYATNRFGYMERVKGGTNVMRWAEYSITATCMLLAIALLSGVGSSRSLILIAASCFSCMWLGHFVETGTTTWKKALATILGWVLLAAAYGTILADFHAIVSHEDDERPKPPDFVWAVVIVMFLFFTSFGFLQLYEEFRSRPTPLTRALQAAGGPRRAEAEEEALNWALRKESKYTLLSMLSKTTLVVLVASGVIGMQGGEDSTSPA